MIRYAVRVLGWLVWFFGCYLMIGYWVGDASLYTFPKGSTAVALPTAAGFAVTGLAIFLISFIPRNGNGKSK